MPAFSDPDVRFQRSFLAAMAEFADEGRAGDGSGIGRDLEIYGPTWQTQEGFARYVRARVAEREDPVDPGWVHNTNLWWVEGDEYLGRMSIRHELNDVLREAGGHIGYDVRRSARRLGHATAMLRAALPIARGLGIESALVTCDVDNLASRKVIEACGGVLEGERSGRLRFWVSTG